jgi:transposase
MGMSMPWAVRSWRSGSQQDEAAVEATPIMSWSSGQTKGYVNNLRLIKRRMYGRASLDLLRRRVLFAA